MRRITASFDDDQLDNEWTELHNELDVQLANTFEDNIIIKYAHYELPEEVKDDIDVMKVYRKYERARDAYLEAITDLIRVPDAIDEIM